MLYFVFDVESSGLHGEGFSYGYVVIEHNEETGEYETLEEDLKSCRRDWVESLQGLTTVNHYKNYTWVQENVPEVEVTYNYAATLRDAFWRAWKRWHAKGAVMAADCPWPVEARFLIACVQDDPNERQWEGPYPLIDVESVRHAARVRNGNLGGSCNADNRLPDELPVHNPLCDARQSARLLVEAKNSLKEN